MPTNPPNMAVSPDRLSWSAGLKEVLRLSGPIIPAMLSQMLIGFFDTWMVSQVGRTHFDLFGWAVPLDTVADPSAGKTALAAVTPAAFMVWSTMCVFVGTVGAVNTFASQSLGRSAPAEAGRYAWQAVHFAAITVLVSLAGWLVAPLLLGRFAPSVEVLSRELSYFGIRIWSLPLVVASSGLSAFFQGIHRPAIPAMIGIGSNLLNVVLNWLLVYGRGGLPRMEIAGAAAASVIATAVGVVALFAWFLAPELARWYGTRTGWRLSLPRLGRLIWIGAPSGLSWLLDMIGWTLLTVALIQPLGETELAASNAAMSYLQIGFMPVVGVGIALTALIGKAVGRRRLDDARRYASCAFAVGGGYQLLVGIVMIVFRHELIWFFNRDPRVIQLGSYALVCAGVFQVFDAMGIVYAHALRGTGDTLFPMLVTLVLTFAMFVPLSYLLTGYVMARWWPAGQVAGPWAAGTLYVALLGVGFLWRWLGNRWEHIDIFGSGQPAPSE